MGIGACDQSLARALGFAANHCGTYAKDHDHYLICWIWPLVDARPPEKAWRFGFTTRVDCVEDFPKGKFVIRGMIIWFHLKTCGTKNLPWP